MPLLVLKNAIVAADVVARLAVFALDTPRRNRTRPQPSSVHTSHRCRMQKAERKSTMRASNSAFCTLHSAFLLGGSMQMVLRRACLVALLVMTANLWAQDLASIEKRVTVKKLDNGLT